MPPHCGCLGPGLGSNGLTRCLSFLGVGGDLTPPCPSSLFMMENVYRVHLDNLLCVAIFPITWPSPWSHPSMFSQGTFHFTQPFPYHFLFLRTERQIDNTIFCLELSKPLEQISPGLIISNVLAHALALHNYCCGHVVVGQVCSHCSRANYTKALLLWWWSQTKVMFNVSDINVEDGQIINVERIVQREISAWAVGWEESQELCVGSGLNLPGI